MYRKAIVMSVLLAAGCATSFQVKEVNAPMTTDRSETVDGILVNRRATYRMSAKSNFLGTMQDGLASKALLNGVDQNRMLSVNICRYPFASGKLTTTLGSSQAIEKFGVTSQTGAARLLEAADQSLATKTALEAPAPTPAAE